MNGFGLSGARQKSRRAFISVDRLAGTPAREGKFSGSLLYPTPVSYVPRSTAKNLSSFERYLAPFTHPLHVLPAKNHPTLLLTPKEWLFGRFYRPALSREKERRGKRRESTVALSLLIYAALSPRGLSFVSLSLLVHFSHWSSSSVSYMYDDDSPAIEQGRVWLGREMQRLG